jgi:hypothetical protein
METNDGPRGPFGRPTRTRWLIGRDREAALEVFAVESDGGRILPVFGFEEEAELFLRLGAFGDGWRARGVSSGELVSVLCGPCARVEKVALDPLPFAVCVEERIDLFCLEREAFARTLLGERRTPREHQAAGGTIRMHVS